MRSDMSKVIVERPRLGGHYARRGRQVEDDLQVSHEGMRAPYVRHYNNKQLNENLAPLRRFLVSRVGQPWDTVYSEISANLRADNTVQQHVRDHVNQYVATHIRIDSSGQIWETDGNPHLLSDGHTRFWVDPRNGLLCLNPDFRSYRRRQEEFDQARRDARAQVSRSLPGGIELRQAQGIWYEVELAPVPPIHKKTYHRADGTEYSVDVGGSAYDVILGQTVYISWKLGSPYASTYCKTKRQLNHRELKKWDLKNG